VPAPRRPPRVVVVRSRRAPRVYDRARVPAEHPALIVDDEEDNLDFLERFLRGRLRPVYRARDGEEALAILDRHRVDLILTDERMPRMRGTALLRHAVERQPLAVRILITGYGDVETLTIAINEGHTYQVINKPIELPMLEMVVRNAIEVHETAMRERELFEAFVFASVSAIEQRDPSTAGHSIRVAAMTTGLAMVVDGVSDGPFRDVRFSRDDLEQIKYASLLHDFGKIGVREAVLTKSHKLPPTRFELLQYRLKEATRRGALDDVTARRYHQLVTVLNDPATAASDHVAELATLEASGLVDRDDLEFLRIETGSLSTAERTAIQAHVVETINFLRQLPWPRRFQRVTEIAGAHHERLDGSGYPSGTTAIPLEAQVMAICDVYDALVASDRPYKTAVDRDRALGILAAMARDGSINADLLELFVARRVYRAMRRHP
jgi:response regulator RpfG family c-di-GMP phosphodiesterase